MARHCMFVAASVASAFEDPMFDSLSLLQVRVQKQESVEAQEPTLADGSVLKVQALGTMCADDEDITFAKCVEAQKRQIIPNGMAHGSVMTKRNLFGDGKCPRGCFKFGSSLVFNDEPAGSVTQGAAPICQVGGGGGRAAEIAAQGMSCQEPTCVQPRGNHLMTWDDSVFVPELKLGAMGGVCEEACGLLTFEQCSKAGDMGLIAKFFPGFTTNLQPNHQTFGPSHTSGTMPSACSTTSQALVYFNSMDTAIGAHAAPDTDGDPWVTPSGVGIGWFQVAPVCGVCTTTTTPPPPATNIEDAGDEASAAGDPHMISNTGKHFDYSN